MSKAGMLLKTLSLVAAVSLFFCAGDAFAQAKSASKAGGAKAALKIKGLSKPDKTCLVSSPDFDGKVRGPNRNSGRGRKWASLEVDYATAPDWLDEVTIRFHVMCQDAEKTFHYFTCTVSYLNIEKGDHGACVMLPPSVVKRYGAPCAFGVEIEIEGKAVAGDSEGVGKGTPWWTKLESVGKLESHSGLLVDRSKTPFGITYIDEYEAVR